MIDDSDKEWKDLASAARGAPEERPPQPPADFGDRLVALRGRIFAIARTLTWRRWSLVAALAAALVYSGVLLVAYCSAPADPILEVPSDTSSQPVPR